MGLNTNYVTRVLFVTIIMDSDFIRGTGRIFLS